MKRQSFLTSFLFIIFTLSTALPVVAKEYDYEKKYLWYETSVPIQELRDPIEWNTAEEFIAELFNHDPLIGFDMDDYINSPAGEGLIETLEPIILFDDEMGEDLLAYWEEKGIKKEMWNEDDEDNKYAIYIPLEAVDSDKKYPLMVLMSGGSDPIFTAEGFGIVAYGAEAGYITVIPQSRDTDQTITMLDDIKERYPIDPERIYITGNGYGLQEQLETVVKYPEYFSAVCPFGTTFVLTFKGERFLSNEELEQNFSEKKLQLPVMILDGTANSTMSHPIIWKDSEYKLDDFNEWLRINNCDFPEVSMASVVTQLVYSDIPANRYTGFEFTNTWEEERETDYYFGEFYDTEGCPMFRIGMAEGASHWHSASYPELIWDFCSMYSRNQETGELIYTP